MFLSRLLKYERIVIQCHDAPDADAIGAGFALYRYFAQRGHEVLLAYGGDYLVEKPNTLAMIKLLKIPLMYQESAPACDLLITVDCQYGSGNVTKWEAPVIAVIDHHPDETSSDISFRIISSRYGSCCTLVWSLLREVGVDVNQNAGVATALYYGLYMDTSRFSEISHPMDRDMRDCLHYQEGVFLQLVNTNMTQGEMKIFAQAIRSYHLDKIWNTALIPVSKCDPNLLGMVSDFIIQVDEIKICVAFMIVTNGCKLSVRSCTEEVRANDLVEFLCRNIGSGGGHTTKAGGFLSEFLLEEIQGSLNYEAYLQERLKNYFDSYKIIRAEEETLDQSDMKHYVKKRCLLGSVRLSDIIRGGTPVLVRTLEGDLECISADSLYIMIGIDGEVYPIQEEKFLRTYEFCEGVPEYKCEYQPTVHNTVTGEAYVLQDKMRTCRAKGTSHIYARPLECCMKVFTQWDAHKYLKGETGDYLAVRADDPHDIYIICRDIFLRSYEEFTL